MPSKVLVVDDDPVLCELLREVLSTELEAHAMTDSAQASARTREEKFDAVFLDVRMPHPDGIELARHIRSSKLNQTTPIVMITGDEDRNAMMRAFQAGATFFLSKPVDRPRLMRLIRATDRKSTRLNSSHGYISYAVFCLKKKKNNRPLH